MPTAISNQDQLIQAAACNDIEKVKKHITPENINAQDEEGNSALHYAAWHGNIDMTTLLMANSANTMLQNKQRKTPLNLAQLAEATSSHNVIAQLQVAINRKLFDAIVNQHDNLGQHKQKIDNKFVRDLLDQGANPNHQVSGKTIATWAAQQKAPKEIMDLFDHYGIHQISWHTPDKAGSPARVIQTSNISPRAKATIATQKRTLELKLLKQLHEMKPIDAIQATIQQGADIGAEDDNQTTALHYAARYPKKNIAALLLKRGSSDLNKRDNNSHTPLDDAINAGHHETIEFLLKQGALISFSNLAKHYYQHYIEHHRSSEAAKAGHISNSTHELLKQHSWQEALYQTIKNNKPTNANDISQLISRKPTQITTIVDCQGNSPWHIAAIHDNKIAIPLCKTLTHQEKNNTNNNGQTALHIASKHGSHQTINFLLNHMSVENIQQLKEQKIDTNIVALDREHGQTALHIAQQNNKGQNLKVMLAHRSIDPNKKNDMGRTLLHQATLTNDSNTIMLLAKNQKTDINATDTAGKTSLVTAAENGQLQALQQLCEYYRQHPEKKIGSQGEGAIIKAIKNNNWHCVTTMLKAGFYHAKVYKKLWRKRPVRMFLSHLLKCTLLLPLFILGLSAIFKKKSYCQIALNCQWKHAIFNGFLAPRPSAKHQRATDNPPPPTPSENWRATTIEMHPVNQGKFNSERSLYSEDESASVFSEPETTM
jgi:ankyrin repeat protein